MICICAIRKQPVGVGFERLEMFKGISGGGGEQLVILSGENGQVLGDGL